MEPLKDYISTKEASKRYPLSASHLARLLQEGVIEGTKIGHDWLIYEPSLEKYLEKPRKPGPKPQQKNSTET